MSKIKSITLWIIAIILMAGISVYQRVTGPTYPVSGSTIIEGKEYDFSLPRTHGGDGGEIIRLYVPGSDIRGKIKYRRFKSYDDWSFSELARSGDTLSFEIPHQQSAGKVEYQISLEKNSADYTLTENPVIIRFKGAVPMLLLIMHIALMFGAMVFSTRTGLEALFKGNDNCNLALITLILMCLGGIIMGPVIQQYAFGALWTGWPFGHDMTDNKAIVAILFWGAALWKLKRNPKAHGWAIAAALLTIAVYLIPHSIFGSELDYTKLPE